MFKHSASFQRKALVSAIVAASFQAGLAHAASEQNNEIEEIQVFGEKQTKNLQDLATSVGVLTQEQLSNSTIQDFNDVYARLANVSTLRGGNESLFSIRGISVQGLSDNPNSFTAGVYIDDVPLDLLSIRYGAMNIWDVEQVEVYRGPQGTLQGRSALTGAIYIKTKDPSYEPEGSIQITSANNNTKRISIAGNGALIEDQLAIRVAVDQYQSDGHVTNVTRNEDDYAGFDRRVLRTKIKYEPAGLEQFSALLSVSKTESHTGDNPNVDTLDPFSNKAYSDSDAFHNVDTDTASLKLSWELNDQTTVSSITTYANDEYNRFDDFDSGPFNLGVIAQNGESDTSSQEFRVNFETDNVSGVAGVYFAKVNRKVNWDIDSKYQKSRVEQTAFNFMTAAPPTGYGLTQAQAQQIWDIIPTLIDVEQLYNSEYDIQNTAIFGEATWRPIEQLAFTFGARYDSEKQERNQLTVTEVLTTTGIAQPDALLAALEQTLNGAGEDIETDYKAFLPKFAAQYYWSDDINTAFSIQRGYRAGGSSVNLFDASIHDFDPEYTWNYELAFRSQWLDNSLTANANIFYTDWKDMQVDFSPTGEPRNKYTTNAGQSNLYGLELEVSYEASDALTVFGNIGYVKTEFDKFSIAVTGGIADYKGNEFLGAPNLTSTIGFNYHVENGFYLAGDVNYSDEAYLDNANTNESDARTLLNVKTGYKQANVEAFVWVNNALDEEYITQSYDLQGIGIQDYATTGTPRAVGATVKVNF